MSFSSYTSSKLSTLHRRFCGERLVMRVGVGVKNSTAPVASYPTLTFFMKKVLCILGTEVKNCFNLNKLLHGNVLVVATFTALDV